MQKKYFVVSVGTSSINTEGSVLHYTELCHAETAAQGMARTHPGREFGVVALVYACEVAGLIERSVDAQ